MVGDSSLDQVPCAVKFVSDRELGPALGPSLDHVVGREVTVRLLSVLYLSDPGINKPLELGIRARSEGPSRRLQPLVQIRIRKPPPPEGCVHLASGTAEVVQDPGRLELVILKGQGNLAVDAPPWFPIVI
jgi:hypothetical protein